MKMTLSRKILTGFIACTIILTAVAFFSFRNSERFLETNKWVDHTQEVLNEFSQLLTVTVDAETGVRGYVISGNEIFLEPYNNSKQFVEEHINRLKELTKDNSVQQKTLQNWSRFLPGTSSILKT